MKMQEILIIGAGFVGTALAHRLADKGLGVHILSPNPRGLDSSRLQLHRGSLEDESLLDTLLSRCDTVFHTASATTPGSSTHDPVLEGTHNILPTLKLLAALQKYPNVHLVYLSSGGCVYGNPVSTPVTETHPLQPQSYHGAGKVAAEAFLHAFRAHSSGAQPVTVLRPSNLYGPGQPLREGFGLVRTVLERLRTDSVLEVWGDGETVRDFIYIDDFVDACERFIDLSDDSDTYNVASGFSCSINELIKIVQRVCGKPLQVRYRTGRRTDVRTVVLDTSKLRKRLNWLPAVTLEEGISRLWLRLTAQ
jgi:UDP-glucose 4-epimerase